MTLHPHETEIALYARLIDILPVVGVDVMMHPSWQRVSATYTATNCFN